LGIKKEVQQKYAYFIWGVNDETHEIVGTTFNQFGHTGFCHIRRRVGRYIATLS